MQVWIYKREVEVGDYVYADGSYSDILNKNKTVVGVCFYAEKNLRLCVGTKDTQNCHWGLFKTDFSEGITLADEPSYSVFDIASMPNVTQSGVASWLINESTYRDPGEPDGFKKFEKGTAASELGLIELGIDFGSFKKTDMLPYGRVNTLKIIQHRNTILQDSSIQLEVPRATVGRSEYEHLEELLVKIQNDNGNLLKYREYYYPGASLCYAYEPSVRDGEELSDLFKCRKWFMPSAGELARIYWYYTQGLFAKAVAEGVFTEFQNLIHASSTEQNELGMWWVNFPNTQLYSAGKNNYNPTRPVAAF